MTKTTPQICDGVLSNPQAVGCSSIVVGSDAWWSWLESDDAGTFRFQDATGSFTARRERRRGAWYWYAYLKRAGALHKSYLGKSADLMTDRLEAVAQALGRRITSAPAPISSPTAPAIVGLLRLPTRLIGREREIGAVARLLSEADTRMVTLLGTGGVGKMSLALGVATHLLPHFSDGIWFIDLSTISDPTLLVSMIAGALGVRQSSRRSTFEALVEHLATRRVLLVLDNFEQVLAGALVVADLLTSCSNVAVLVTSREPLRLRWERQWPVRPLELPAPGRDAAVADLAICPAVALFIERAQAVAPSFALHAKNASAVAQICVQPDGLPLAIELAAARVKVLSPYEILMRLERRLDLAGQDIQDYPSRHRTLRATIAWSYELLDDRQRAIFRRLGVFVGGCTLEAAAVVCLPNAGAEGERRILEALASLIDKQLLRHEVQPDDTSRFRMPETIREYAQEQLVASGEVDEVRQRHARYYLSITQEAVEGPSSRPNAFSNGLDLEVDNFRATLQASLAAGEIALGLRLLELLYGRWAMLGLHREGREWLEVLLARARTYT